MNPHHSKYYSALQETPTDFDDPIPIPFLSVQGKFLVGVSADRSLPRAREWLDLAFGLIAEALEQWGIGGKTSSGYGRLTP
jgi:CRISPR-associated protein Cmr6